jgi:DNA-binding FadR family transcriptional regulator
MSSSIKSIKKRSVANEVYEQLAEMITSGTWKPGAKIPSETELSAKFNVSRNTIRGALQELKGIGILYTRQGQGTFIKSSNVDSVIKSIIPLGALSDEEVVELAQFRKAVEFGCVYFAAINRTDDDLVNIKQALNDMRTYLGDYGKHATADYEFHLAIARASRNRYFYRTYISLKDIMYRHFLKMSRELGTEISIEAHEAIYMAIKDQDGESAQAITARNITQSLNMLETRIK